MAILINAHEISKSFTTRPLFSEITFSIESGERVGLIGPNGAGKSTLLKILAGKLAPDDGTLSVQRGLRIGYLEQVPTFKPDATIESAIYESLHDPHDWQEISKAQEMMSKLSLSDSAKTPPTTLISELSGGWKKRVALTRELLREPDLLLLDEPTNHLDVESILWLEEFLAHAAFGTITITHDRLFLQRVSNRIIELDRRHPDGLLSINGDYAKYLEVREQLMSAQELQETKLRNTLRRETEWLRRGAKARQTKQQARIKNAGHLKDEVEELRDRNQTSTVRIDFQNAEKNPKRLIEAQEITKSYGGKLIIPKISLKLTPKSRIGLLGSNGAGKSTLIRLLLNQEKPDTGHVVHADQLQVAYFEQNRESLDPNITLEKTVCSGGDHVDFRGTKVHVKSYLSRFLFRHEQMGLPVGKLSGGEQSRLLIARLMLKHANVLVLDEPTNDLDITTLDVLADVLEDFNGGVILVSHDRYFLDHVANQILAFGYDGKGHKTIESFADLEQWEAWHDEQARLLQDFKKKGINLASMNTSTHLPAGAVPGSVDAANLEGTKKKKKLSYKDQREFDGMEAAIKKAEEHLAHLTHESTKPEFASNASKLTEISSQMAQAQAEVDRLYARWAELEN